LKPLPSAKFTHISLLWREEEPEEPEKRCSMSDPDSPT
jgi:hypothetical protein